MLNRVLLFLLILVTCPFAASAAELFPTQSDWKYFVGTSEASSPDTAAWRMPGFDDSSWPTGQTPIGYGEPDIVTDLGTSQNVGYLSVFLRKGFNLDNPADFARLDLSIRIDDGYVVWINGNEVGRYNVPAGELSFNRTAVNAIEPVDTTVTVTNAFSVLREGVNVVAVHVFNANTTSSDLYLDASLTGVPDDEPPVVIGLRPPASVTVRQLFAIEVQFNKPVQGVDAEDLLINGTPATGLTEGEPGQFVFDFPQPSPGTVNVSWAPDHGITDLTSSANAFEGGSWSYTLDPDSTPPGLLISEFMASNQATLNDEDGDRSDWIELHNAGELTEDLNGWFLTDDPNDLTQWQFPAVSIAPNGYLLVFASGKNRRIASQQLHTNFRLAREGEYLALVDPGTNVVSEFAPAFPAQFDDISYGRDRVNPSVTGYFPVPTPNAPNTTGGAGFAPEVRFSRPGGSFLNGFSLELTTGSASAEIRYTTDGTFPTETSPLYSSPIFINSTTQVRARAFEPGLLPGLPATGLYLQLASSLTGFTSDLPLLVIHNFGAGSVPASPVTERQFVAIALFEPGATGRASLTNTARLAARAGINIRGSSTKGLPKSSYRLEFRDDFGDDRNLELLGMPSEDDWILYAPNQFDLPLIHNPFIYQLSNDIDRYAPRTRLVEVFLNTSGGAITGPVPSGNYRGIYVLMENIKRDNQRVDIQRLEPEHTSPPEITGGYLLKVDRVDPDERTFNAGGQTLIYRYPNGLEMVTPQRAAQANYISDYFNAFGNALNGANYLDPVTGYAAYIDVPAWIDHSLLNVLALNVDALRLSTHLFKPREGKIHMGPIWDFDRAMGTSRGDIRPFDPIAWMGNNGSGGGDSGTDFFNAGNVYHNPWYSRLFTDPDFWQQWIDRYQHLRTAQFSTNHVFDLVESLAGRLREAQPRDRSRWSGSGGSDPTPRSGTVSANGYTHNFPGTYQGEIDFMKRWLGDRLHFMDTNFLNPPRLSRPGGEIEPGLSLSVMDLSGKAGTTLYYTLDGTDPRAPGGGLTASAIQYSSPVTLSSNLHIIARARNPGHQNLTGPGNPPISSPWSGPVSATYIVHPAPLIISEILYHPVALSGDTFETEDYEYLELMHTGGEPLNLLGFQFTRGISFTFPSITLDPGQRIVLAKKPDAFHERYGNAFTVLGPYDGQLDNAGERLTLLGPIQETVLDFSYADDWYPITDGHGFSLVLNAPDVTPDQLGDPWSWRRSTSRLGSPGSQDAPLPLVPPVRVNEALTHTDPPLVDSIELFNPASFPVDISGWFLTDSFDNPFKFRIPDGTLVPSRGHLVFDEDDFNTGTTGSFALSSHGESVFLFSADAGGLLTGYVHGFDFGASENGVSFGLHPDSQASEHFVAQTLHTLGAPNAGPRVGPIVINEIMHDPPATFETINNERDEFVELHNITGQAVPLFDPLRPTNTWRLDDGIRFQFPPGLTMDPGTFLLVVGFDPHTQPNDLQAFRSYYQLDESTLILGPYAGLLDNAGERVQLLKPDPPEPEPGPDFGLVPYVLVDEIDYSNQSPWPTGAGATGLSIQRVSAATFGNDPVNWQAADPTPGASNRSGSLYDTDGDGLPDDWEIAHNLDPLSAEGDDGAHGDPDDDGFTNIEEY
ncbi:MAG TPA: lamin tail domain-containing protein, partial [Methylomirabilota bacterium]|nr:lamin tail domain-containing protein [Methylomirabilota bacterium]